MIKLYLPLIFGLLGLIVSSRAYINFFDTKSPLLSMLVYYILIFCVLFMLQKTGLVIADIQFTDLRHIFGSMLIIFSFFIVVKSESCRINEVTNRKCNLENLSNLYISKEDGVLYHFYSKITDNLQYRRLLTYVISPIILTIVGLLLIGKNKVRLSPF